MVGRKKERKELEELLFSGRSELVAIYGRRRVGKTFLVDEVLGQYITFRHAGLSPVEKNGLKIQLKQFYYSLLTQGFSGDKCPNSWLEAFFFLEKFLQERDNGGRQVVFIDELPWMDTPRSGFISAFEGFWNNWACHRKNVMVVICGSASSWIKDKLLNNHGGLYGRVTHEIGVHPFKLSECREFYESYDIKLSDYDIVQSYMIFGGIPFYLKYLRKGLSLAQNIDELFFKRGAVLADELNRMFISVFEDHEQIKAIVQLLSKKSIGFTRNEISEETGIKGIILSDCLNALIASDLITKYIPFGQPKNKPYYKLTDPFCIFYIRFVSGHDSLDESFWMDHVTSQNLVSWRGFAFENICFSHISEIKKALEINAVVSRLGSLAIKDKDGGTQIDLVIERKDGVINLCEMKFCSEEFNVDKSCYLKVRERERIVTELSSKKTVVHNVLITTFGVKDGGYASVFSNVITVDELLV